MVTLSTSSWRSYRPSMGVAVRITLGLPPSWFKHPYAGVRLLAPPLKVFALEDDAAFEAAYLAHLDAGGVDRIWSAFEGIPLKHGSGSLVLLCFENVFKGELCHRSMFASWWEQNTGQVVPELELRGAQGLQEPLFP